MKVRTGAASGVESSLKLAESPAFTAILPQLHESERLLGQPGLASDGSNVLEIWCLVTLNWPITLACLLTLARGALLFLAVGLQRMIRRADLEGWLVSPSGVTQPGKEWKEPLSHCLDWETPAQGH